MKTFDEYSSLPKQEPKFKTGDKVNTPIGPMIIRSIYSHELVEEVWVPSYWVFFIKADVAKFVEN